MSYKLTINQKVWAPGDSYTEGELASGNIVKFSIYSTPGVTIKINENEIIIGNTGLFNFELPESLYDQGVKFIKTTEQAYNRLKESGCNLVIDYVTATEEKEVQNNE